MVKEDELLKACAVLFGTDIPVSRDFLRVLEVSGVKAAYRKRVRETHPDLNPSCAGIGDPVHDFIRVQEAYERLVGYLSHRGGRTNPHGMRAQPNRQAPAPQTLHPAHHEERNRSSDFHKRPPSSSQFGGQGEHWSTDGKPSPRPTRATEGVHENEIYRGPLPRRPLILGHYLYYSGKVDWRTVIQAVGWQMIQRPRIGELASRVGWLANCDVHRIDGKKRLLERFGESAIRLQLLTEFQVKVLLLMQKRRQRKLGEYFVQQGLFTREEMDTMVRACLTHNESFAQASEQAS